MFIDGPDVHRVAAPRTIRERSLRTRLARARRAVPLGFASIMLLAHFAAAVEVCRLVVDVWIADAPWTFECK